MSMRGGSSPGQDHGYAPISTNAPGAMGYSQMPMTGVDTPRGSAMPGGMDTGMASQWNGQPTGGTMVGPHGTMAPGMEKPGNTLNPGAHGTQDHSGKVMIDRDTGQAPRRCTDICCCFVFLVYALLCVTLVFNAHLHGDMGRLTHGTDYYGRTCGVDAGVENMPFLFWCRADASTTGTPTSLDLSRPSCVPYCPVSNEGAVTIPCLQLNTHQSSQVANQQFGNTRTMVFQFQESIVETAPYQTYPRGGRYCMPKDLTLESLVLSDNRALGTFSSNRVLTTLGTLGHLYWLLAICCAVSCLCGYGFMYAIKFFPRSIVYPFTYPGILLFSVFGLGFSFAFLPLISPTMGVSVWYMKQNPFFTRWDVTIAAVWSFITAVGCWLLSFCFYNMTQNFDSLSNDVSTADLMGCSTECNKAVGGMWYIPLAEAIVKFLVFFCGLQGLRVLASEGWIEKNRIHVNGAEFAGLSRELVPATEDWRFYVQAVLWLVGFRWCMEICSAFAHFMICWCVFQWWRVKKEGGKKKSPPKGIVCEGVRNAILYHLGSIFLGAMSIPLWRPWRFLYWATSEIDPDQPTGVIGNCFHKLCCCCLSCIGSVKERAKEEIQNESAACKDGFNDVVIRSNDYFESVEKAHVLLEHSHKIVQSLYRSLWSMTLHIIAVSASSSLTAGAVYIVVCNLDMYKEPTSELYIADPFLVTFLSFLLSSYIVSGFMNLWDHTSDCLLYCYCWHRRWARKTVDSFCPDSLRFIVGFDDTEHDRYPYYGRAKNNMYLRYWMPMFGMTHGGGKE